jgi:hypothetical protein
MKLNRHRLPSYYFDPIKFDAEDEDRPHWIGLDAVTI